MTWLIILLLKIFLISGLISLTGWVAVYHRLTHGAVWHDHLGRTLVVKTLLIAGLFIPSILSLFLHLNRQNSLIVAWADVALVGAVTPVMIWRTIVWIKESRRR